MMIRSILLMLSFWSLVLPTIQACDACGCSMSGVYWGLVPNNSNHYLGLWWQHQRYTTGLGDAEVGSNQEWFNTVELRGRIQLGSKVQLMTILPYAHHIRENNGHLQKLNGLADAIVMGSYTVLNTQDSLESTIRHRLTLGGGLKLPTGQFQQSEVDNIVNPGFQLGTGSWDMLFNLGYTARLRKFGLNADLTYKKNTTNQNEYRFGNRISGALNLFYMAAHRSWELMPNLGLFGEYSEWDVQEGYYRTFTGGYGLFGTLGLELYHGAYNFGANFNIPLHQDFNDGSIEAQSRLSVHINYFF